MSLTLCCVICCIITSVFGNTVFWPVAFSWATSKRAARRFFLRLIDDAFFAQFLLDENWALLSSFGTWRIVFISVLLLLLTFGTFFYLQRRDYSLELSRTAAVNALFAVLLDSHLTSIHPSN